MALENIIRANKIEKFEKDYQREIDKGNTDEASHILEAKEDYLWLSFLKEISSDLDDEFFKTSYGILPLKKLMKYHDMALKSGYIYVAKRLQKFIDSKDSLCFEFNVAVMENRANAFFDELELNQKESLYLEAFTPLFDDFCVLTPQAEEFLLENGLREKEELARQGGYESFFDFVLKREDTARKLFVEGKNVLRDAYGSSDSAHIKRVITHYGDNLRNFFFDLAVLGYDDISKIPSIEPLVDYVNNYYSNELEVFNIDLGISMKFFTNGVVKAKSK